MEMSSLAGIGFDALSGAFGQAFADYEVQLTPGQLASMLRRRGFDPALSFAAFDEGRMAAFTLNGTGTFGGVPTAYDTGTGTLPRYRGQGLATGIFEASISSLRAAGIGQYLLEVLQHNTTAVSIYRNLGFEVRREFNYFRTENGNVQTRDLSGGHYTVRHVELKTLKEAAQRFWDFEPSWQNGFEAIGRASEDFVFLGAFDGERLAGYAVFEPAAGDITQIAVDRECRRRGIASLLLARMLPLNRTDGVKCINTEIACGSITRFLEASGIPPAGRQFEMIKSL